MASSRDNDTVEACRERALLLLERRAHSVREMRRKLRQKGFGAKAIGEVVTDLVRVGLLDDAQFAAAYCEYRMNGSRPMGANRVRGELIRKGVPREVIDEALAQFEEGGQESELERALAAASVKWASLCSREEDPRKRRQKLMRFLSGRGFGASTCYEIADRLRARD